MARIVWSKRAADDLESICSHIEADSEHYARIVARRVVETVDSILTMPESGSIVPEYDQTEIRERFVYRYRIVYRIAANEVEIVMIRHASRLLPDRPPGDSL